MTEEATISSNWRSEQNYVRIRSLLERYWDDLNDSDRQAFMIFVLRSLLVDGFEHPHDNRDGEIARALSIVNSIKDPNVDRKNIDIEFKDGALQAIARSVQYKRAVHDETGLRIANLGSRVDVVASRLDRVEEVLSRFTLPFRALDVWWRATFLPWVRWCRLGLRLGWQFANTPLGVTVVGGGILSGLGVLVAWIAGAF